MTPDGNPSPSSPNLSKFPQLLPLVSPSPSITPSITCSSNHRNDREVVSPLLRSLSVSICRSSCTMGNIFSHSDGNNDPNSPNSSLRRQHQLSSTANNAGLKQTIAQNMRLSKGKVSSLLKANHMNYSIVHRNHFYNTLPHVRIACSSN